MSPAGQSSAHCALNAIGAPKPANAPAPPAAAPASDGWYAKQQTCPPEQCCVLEHPSDDPVHEPADVQLNPGAAPPPKGNPPPAPFAPASLAGALA
jgi:hypothetical protein